MGSSAGIRRARAVALLALLAAAAPAAASDEPSPEPVVLKFGFVAHDAGMDAMFRDLLEEFNRSLGRDGPDGEREAEPPGAPDGYFPGEQRMLPEGEPPGSVRGLRIAERPRALAYTDLAKLESLGIDFAYVTPVVNAELQTWEGRPFAPVACMQTLAPSGEAASRASFVSNYGWMVLLDPTVVDRSSLASLRPGRQRPRCGWMPLSASGHLFPLRAMGREAGLPREDGEFLPGGFDAVEIRTSVRMLDGLFAPLPEDRIAVAPVTTRSLRRYLEAGGEARKRGARTALARLWLHRVSGEQPPEDASLEEVARRVEEAGSWTGRAGAIHNGLFVCRRGLAVETRSRLVDAILESGSRIRRAFADPEVLEKVRTPRSRGEYPPEVQARLRDRLSEIGCPGLSRTLLRAMDGQDFHGIGAPPGGQSLRDVGACVEWYAREGYRPVYVRPGRTVSAAELVRDVARDIGHQRALGELRGEPYEPRVALVLAGGGASGAYQAGAMRSLLVAMRSHNLAVEAERGDLERVDIRIVAGTSVGALNGVVAAAAGSFDPRRREARDEVLGNLWSGIDAPSVLATMDAGPIEDFELRLWRHLAGGSWIVRYLLPLLAMVALGFGLLRAFAAAARMDGEFRHWFFGILGFVSVALLVQKRSVVAVGLFGCVVALYTLAITPRFRGTAALVLGSLMLGISAPVFDRAAGVLEAILSIAPLAAPGLVWFSAGVVEYLRPGVLEELARPPARTAPAAAPDPGHGPAYYRALGVLALLGILALWGVDVLVGREAVFQNRKLAEVLGQALTEAAGGGAKDPVERLRDLTGLAPPGARSRPIDEERIRSLAALAPPGGIDVVVTATDLMESGDGRIRPREVCLHWGASPTPDRGGSSHWVDLRKHPGSLVEALLASAAIFPGFPPVLFPKDGPTLRLIDGGFLTNVPTGPALELGATHLVVLQFERPEGSPGAAARAMLPREKRMWRTSLDISEMLLQRAQGSSVETVGDRRTYVLAPTDRWVPTAGFDGGRKSTGGRATLAEFLEFGAGEARKELRPEHRDGEGRLRIDPDRQLGFLLYRP